MRPDFRFLFAHPAHLIAFGFGSGLAPKAPGTVGTLLGLPLYWLIVAVAPDLPNQIVLVIAKPDKANMSSADLEALLLELVLQGTIMGEKTTKGWIFWVEGTRRKQRG